MYFEEWETYYKQILLEFGFSREEDERSASILSGLFVGKNLASQEELIALIQGNEVVVVGGGKNLKQELNRDFSKNTVIAADGTTSNLLRNGVNPHIIVTDMDGNIEDQISANRNGAIVAIHAHGDNIEQIKKWTPRFEGKLIGTVQCRPFDSLYNFGGFTDGDRGVFIAKHFGAKNIHLIGFDFDNVGDKDNCDKETKLRKLGWAKKLIESLDILIE